MNETIQTIGWGGAGAASLFYLSRAIYTLATQRNGNSPATLKDVVRAIRDHAEEEEKHHSDQAASAREMLTELRAVRDGVARLIGRGD